MSFLSYFRPRPDGRMAPKPDIEAIQREIEAGLARRKAMRASRSAAAVQGWRTRRGLV